MKCNHCGFENDEGTLFCTNCGTSLKGRVPEGFQGASPERDPSPPSGPTSSFPSSPSREEPPYPNQQDTYPYRAPTYDQPPQPSTPPNQNYRQEYPEPGYQRGYQSSNGNYGQNLTPQRPPTMGGFPPEGGKAFGRAGDPKAQVPGKFNFGAMMLTIPWAIGMKVYIAILISFIPIAGFIWCGLKGNEWAWQKGGYRDMDEFIKVQETWNRAGLASLIIALVIGVIMVILNLMLLPLISLVF